MTKMQRILQPTRGLKQMVKIGILAAAIFAAGLSAHTAMAGETPAPKDAYVYIGWPNDGEVVRNTRFPVWFGLRHIGVAPAGIVKPKTGHHHLLVDTGIPPLDEDIPSVKTHLHFGAGQTEKDLELPH